jgi:hypothetical protein
MMYMNFIDFIKKVLRHSIIVDKGSSSKLIKSLTSLDIQGNL